MDFASGSRKSGKLDASAEAYLRQWASAHPMQGPTIRRASILTSDWDALGVTDSSFAATLGNVDRTIVNISYRLSYLNETLAAQARWNAQLAAEDAMSSPTIGSFFDTGIATLHSVGTLGDDTPALIDRERVALMGDLARERVAIMHEIDQQRELTFHDLTSQRVALEAALTTEQKAVMARLEQERIASFQSADALAIHSIDHLGALLRRVAWEITLAALLMVVSVLVSALAVIHRWRATAAWKERDTLTRRILPRAVLPLGVTSLS